MPLLDELQESDDDSIDIDFSHMASKSETIKKAIEDAELFLRDRKTDSAFDRIHTAFHGYLQTLLDKHEIECGNESISALYSKLHEYYKDTIQPPEVGERIRQILRSGGAIITSINELRNNNAVSHPNEQLIEKREAELAIKMISAIVDYIDDIERSVIEG